MTQPDYEQKKRECWNECIREYVYLHPAHAFNLAFDRAFALGQQEAQLLNNPKQLDAEVGTKGDTKGDTMAPTFTDDCKSQCKSPDRLRIAAKVMQAILGNSRMSSNLCAGETTPEAAVACIVRASLMYADALINEVEKGGSL